MGTKVLVVAHTNFHRRQSRPQIARDRARSRRDRVEIATKSRRDRTDRTGSREGPMLLADSAAARHVAGWHGIIAEA